MAQLCESAVGTIRCESGWLRLIKTAGKMQAQRWHQKEDRSKALRKRRDFPIPAANATRSTGRLVKILTVRCGSGCYTVLIGWEVARWAKFHIQTPFSPGTRYAQDRHLSETAILKICAGETLRAYALPVLKDIQQGCFLRSSLLGSMGKH